MTAPPPHKCSFPVQPPHGSITDPGPCECGRTYLAEIARQRAAEAGLLVVSPPDLHRLVLLALPVTREDDAFVERMRAASEAGQ